MSSAEQFYRGMGLIPATMLNSGDWRRETRPRNSRTAGIACHLNKRGRRIVTHPYAVQAVLDWYPDLPAHFVARRLRRFTFVSVDKRYMYFSVPKAACTSMKALINHIENAPPIKYLVGHSRETRREMFIHERANVPLPSLLDLDDRMQREVLHSPDFLRMTVVRNPYKRLISAWKDKVLLCEPGFESVYLDVKGRLPNPGEKSLITFEEFVEYLAHRCDLRICDPHWRLQTCHTFFHAMNFSFVGKVRKMSEVVGRLQKHLGVTRPLPMACKNPSGHMASVQIGGELGGKIYRLFRKDFETFDYDRNSLPAYQESKGAVPEQKYIDEIIERNVIITQLYNQRSELQKARRPNHFSFKGAWSALLHLLAGGSSYCRSWLAKKVLSSGSGLLRKLKR